MGQTCYQAVILQALLHNPTLNAYFLAGRHDTTNCSQGCMACATADVFMEFNSGEKTDAVSAANLLYNGWDASRVWERS
jgi:ubiquitin carboxyl-terminal hydrolase 22/27/51